MPLTIDLNLDHFNTLDISPVQIVIDKLQQEKTVISYEQQLQFRIDYTRDADDFRELSEIPEVRLWFVRLDSVYPWITFLLDWKAGELVRYAAMLVPHQFNRVEGIQYNPEALEIFVMQKVFILADWLKLQGISSRFRVKSLAQLFGYDLDDTFLKMLDSR